MPAHTHSPGQELSSAHTRPQRRTLCGEDGRRLSLAEGAEAFVRLNGITDGDGGGGENDHGPALVLGLGAEAGRTLAEGPLRGCTDVLWLECPAFLDGMEAQHAAWGAGVPDRWQRLCSENGYGALPHGLAASAARVAQGRRVYWHTQNLRLFPSFWGPVLGAVQAALLGLNESQREHAEQHAASSAYGPPSTVLLPGTEADLLHRELAEAFAGEGFCVCPLDAGKTNERDFAGLSLHSALRSHLKADRPALFFSVNGRGLDAQGVDFTLLRACGVPVVLWLVDNPWHILSAWRQGWWREAHIFVTDHSFISALKQAGATSVHHLPLAVAQHMRTYRHNNAPDADTQALSHLALIHFVGRASFPARDKFFAAARVPESLMEEARTLLDTAPLSDFHWWTRKLGVPLWPGYAVRAAGLGAERCASLRRARWLDAALPAGLAVHGDAEGWRTLLPHAPTDTFHPAVDYYNALPEVYARAPYSLNVTSLLLPAGLTQRHFDVWAAGGFLLSDNTAGLDIFPAELTQEMRLAGPQNLPEAVNRLERDGSLRLHLQTAWRAHLDAAHTYAHRVRSVLEVVSL